jgi:hypothetical protein
LVNRPGGVVTTTRLSRSPGYRKFYGLFISGCHCAVSNFYRSKPIFRSDTGANRHTASSDGTWSPMMLDAILVTAGCAFFVMAVLYTTACDRV